MWGRDPQEVRTIFAMLFTMPGVPCIYYGDEIGMKFLPDSPNKEGGLLDNIQRCGSRTPMQWSQEINAGFSTASADRLYLPIDSSESRPDVASQENDPASLLNFTRALLKLRRENPALANTASFQPLDAEKNQYPFVYMRAAATQRVIVSINPAAKACTVNLGDFVEFGSVRPLFTQGAVFHDGRLQMGPVSFSIFAIE
jgi:maltose alpha-D-glucosyltransferase/alpha-amylase